MGQKKSSMDEIIKKDGRGGARQKKSPVPPIVDAEENSNSLDHSNPEQNPIDVANSQMDPGTKKILEGMYLHGMSIKQACEYAGVKYYRSKTVVTRSELARLYIVHLLERAAVIREFGVDDMNLVELVKIRDSARKLGQEGAATRAHEICMKAIGRLSKEERAEDPLRPVKDMTREEMLDEFNIYKMKADGKALVSTEESVKSEKDELLARRPAATATPKPPNEWGAMFNES